MRYTPYLLPSFLAATVCWGTLIFLWRNRFQKGGSNLILLGVLAGIWAMGYTLEIASVELAAKVFWAKTQYVAIPFIAPLFLTFTLDYTYRERWATRKTLALLFTLPALVSIFAFTTEFHGWVWRTYYLDTTGPFMALVVEHGGFFWLFWLYSQGALLISTALVLSDVRHFPALFRGQIRFLLLAVSAPWFTNALYVLNLKPVPNYDLTPFGFAISVAAFAWASLRHQFISLMPIAHQVVFENMQEGALVLDPHGRIVEINQAAQDLTGLTHTVVGLLPAVAFAQPSVLSEHLADIREKKTTICQIENLPHYLELQISSIKGKRHTPVGWLVLLRDITEYKISEKRLQEAEAKYRALVENGPFVTYIDHLDEQASTFFISSQVENLLGYAAEAFTASPTMWVDLIHPDERARVLKEITRHTRSGETFQSEYRLLARNGQVVWVLDKAVLIQITPEAPFYRLGVWQDITEQKIFSQQLIAKADELKRSNIDLQQFAYAVSHDLQEPLRTVNTYIQLFHKRYANPSDQESAEFIQFIVDGAHRMKKMIDDLLEYSRVSTRGQPLVLTDCNRVVQHQLAYLLPYDEQSEASITYDNLPCLVVDEVQIGQLFRNLLGNAVKYRSTAPLCIHVSARWMANLPADRRTVTARWAGQGEGAWLFAIKDNGIGIAPEYHERIFQIFQRLHTREEYPGTGIGLALCKRIVERHGGGIWVDSQVGRGATFYFTLPAAGAEIKALSDSPF